MLISKRWYISEKQIEQESQTQLHPFIIGLNDSMNSKTSIHTEQYFPDSSFHLPTILFNETHSKVNYRKAYVTINELSKKAIQAGLDASSSAIQELEDFMNGFITKHVSKKKDKKNKRQYNNENETTSDYSSSNKDFIAIENPVVYSKRGASRKKRIKNPHKLESKNSSSAKHSQTQKIRKPTQCQQYQNTGHNKAGCEA
ncbi:41645_t:CDS:1 [Gigaspora margarita]|uniref:41645_t:CDS:1 n=1 Tax=Gigaspora margarita TaxID=4874 RepID=A0ABN7W297_GIGMA|nr:41645_t:CDS:1 [Gigaspora margarita]